jgi:hypothetical protein
MRAVAPRIMCMTQAMHRAVTWREDATTRMAVQNKACQAASAPARGARRDRHRVHPIRAQRAGHIGQRDGAHEAAPARVGNLFITPAAHLTGEKEIFAAPQIKLQRPYAICTYVVCL